MFPEPAIPASMVRLLSSSLQHRHLLVRELQRGGSNILLKVHDRRGAWIGRMQLVEAYTLHLEPMQAAFARLAQVLRAAVGDPSTTRAREASLGGYNQVIRVGVTVFLSPRICSR
jgi:transposase